MFNLAVTNPLCRGEGNGTVQINFQGGFGALSYSMSFNPITGGGANFQAGNFFSGLPAGAYPIYVKDGRGYTLSKSMVLTDPEIISLSPASLASTARLGQPFTQNFQASGGTGKKTLTLSGALPSGLTFTNDPANSAGTISGAPAQSGSFSFTLTATDQFGCAGSRSYTLVVNASLTIASTTLTRTAGSPAANAQIAAIDRGGDTGPLTVTVNGAASATAGGVTVSGLSVNASGQVMASVGASCTATSAAFTMRVTNSGGQFDEATLNVTVNPNTPPSLGAYPAASATAGGAAIVVTPSAPPTDNGSVTSLTASAPGFAGALTGNPATGAITIANANPPGGYTVTVTATDNCGAQAMKTFTLTVTANTCGITVNPATLPQPYVGAPYARILSATPAGNYTFSVSAGQLPPGLRLVTALGVSSIAGLPTTPGAFNFTIKARKNNSTCEATRNYTMTIPATVVPILECVQRNQNGSWMARFGYLNQTSSAVTIPAGSDNYFTPGSQNRGQTTVFQPGRVTNAFSVTFNAQGNNLAAWILRGPDGVLRPVNVLTTSIGCP